MDLAGASDAGLDAPSAAPEQQPELGARLQELVRQAEAQAQQVRAPGAAPAGELTHRGRMCSWSSKAGRVLSSKMCCNASSATTEANKPCGAEQRSRSVRLQASWLASESCACGWKRRCATLPASPARGREAAPRATRLSIG